MNDPQLEDEGSDFVSAAKARFDDSVQGLDGHTRSRLNRGRQQALVEFRPAAARWSRWLPAAGMASVAALAIVLWGGHGQPGNVHDGFVASDMDILMEDDNLDMLEDLDFYRWVDLDDDGGADDNVG